MVLLLCWEASDLSRMGRASESTLVTINHRTEMAGGTRKVQVKLAHLSLYSVPVSAASGPQLLSNFLN